jgi:hypothetical protein
MVYAVNGGSRTRFQTKVWLHVYDISPANDYLWPVGCGLHHSGIEVLGTEYSFASGAGIWESGTPMVASGAKFRERIEMGSFDGGSERLKLVLDELRDTFHADSYHLIRRNCNHFANALTWELLQKRIPSYVNRVSDLAICLSCLIPKKLLEHAPVGDPNDQGKTSPESFYAKSASTSTAVFSGTGHTLSDSVKTTERQGLLSRFGNGNDSNTSAEPPDELTDRREKARKAALARLELTQQQTLSDKQS